MIINKRLLALLALLGFLAVPFCAMVDAASDDVFAFIPSGGRTLLADAVKGAKADAVTELLSGKRTTQEWLAYLNENSGRVPVLKDFDDRQRATLASYLFYNMPLPQGAVPTDPTAANLEKALPPDGRDLALTHCQSCHIITVTVTQDRTREAWLGTMHKPSHIEISTTPTEREALADYLVLNAGISIDDVPEELRAGGASY